MKVSLRKMSGIVSLVTIAGVIFWNQAPAYAQPGERITIELKDVDFSDALDILFKNTGVSKVIKPGIVGLTPTISLQLTDADWEVALKFIAEAANVKYRKEGSVYIFEPKPRPADTGYPSGTVGAPPPKSGIQWGQSSIRSSQATSDAPQAFANFPVTVPALEENQEKEKPHYERYEVKHVYSGGLAILFGGTVIPTIVVASPVFSNGGIGYRGNLGIGGGGFGGMGIGNGMGSFGGGGFGNGTTGNNWGRRSTGFGLGTGGGGFGGRDFTNF